jgi:AraC family transcriptional regulator
MTFLVHSRRYEGSSHLHTPLDWPDMRIEHRLLMPGGVRPAICTCVAINVALAGRTPVRWMAGGAFQQVAIQPGMASIQPVGLDDKGVEITSPVESVHIFLAPSVIASSALADFDIDPARAELADARALSDPLLGEVARAFHEMISRPPEPTDRLFIEGARSMLVAHLVSKYANIHWRRGTRQPSLPDQKLKRVMDLIETRFAEKIGLSELAAEACLSQFHFSRLFRSATGSSPHRYVTERRIQDAKTKLAEGRLSLAEIAFEAGFASQASFHRAFRKYTGLTPGQFRRC